MNLLELSDDILEKVSIELKYIEKQKYYDKCKIWLMKDVSGFWILDITLKLRKVFKIYCEHGHICEIADTNFNKIDLMNLNIFFKRNA